MVNNEKIGKFILACRKEKGLTQQGLADKLYLTSKAVSKWERGLSLPDITILEPLSEALGISVVELLAGEKMKHVEKEMADQLITDTTEFFVDNINRKNRVKLVMLGVLFTIILIMTVINYSHNELRKDYVDIYQTLNFAEENAIYVYECITDNDRDVLTILSEDEYKNALYFTGGSLVSFEMTDVSINKYNNLKGKSDQVVENLTSLYNLLHDFQYRDGVYITEDYEELQKITKQLYESCMDLREGKYELERKVGVRE